MPLLPRQGRNPHSVQGVVSLVKLESWRWGWFPPFEKDVNKRGLLVIFGSLAPTTAPHNKQLCLCTFTIRAGKRVFCLFERDHALDIAEM